MSVRSAYDVIARRVANKSVQRFTPDNLQSDTPLSRISVLGGFIPARMKTHAIKGHHFGLNLSAAEREQLIAFLRSL